MLRSLTALGMVLALSASAEAGRVPSSKAERDYNYGARTDITVPYLTNNRSTLGVWQGVSPIITPSPGPGGFHGDTERPVFTLIFSGPQKSSTPAFIFATQRPP